MRGTDSFGTSDLERGIRLGLAGVYLVAAFACGAPEPSKEPSANATPDREPYRREILEWRRARYDRLTAPDGWLSLVGLFPLGDEAVTFGTDPEADLAFPAEADDRLFGTIRPGGEGLESGSFVVESEPGVELRRGEETVETTVLTLDGPSSPALEVPPFRLFVIGRSGRHYLRVRDLTRPARVELPQIDSYPIDPSWRVEARFEAYDPPRTIAVPTVLDAPSDSVSPGSLLFERDGATHRLDALEAGDELFVILADTTSGEATYGGGRYLYTELPDAEGRVVVDFNKAHNPPCVFTDYATCPLPPPQNRLDTAVEAGEKMVHGYLDH